jgi:NAD(P)-dependent dehydrogenase (short-subunit alcohol dehydrogenase family)
MNSSVEQKRAPVRPLSILGKIAVTAATVYAVRKLAARKLPGEKAQSNSQLQDKVVLIVGGSRGLGLALAFEFGARGSRLALCARNEEELNAACRRLSEKGIEALPFVADITHSHETAPLIERVIQQFGQLDVLVNDAGEIQVGPLSSFTHADFESAMNLMFWGPVNLTFAALPHMSERGSGQIVNITSIGGRVSVPHLLPYCCAKFALVGFSSGLATEVKRRGIYVLTVVPGLMRTGSYLHAKFAGNADAEFTWFGLLGNMPGLSVAAETAARQILAAIEAKKHNCTISVPAKLLVGAETLFPHTTRTIMGYINAILPSANQPTPQTQGRHLNSRASTAFQAFTALGKQAARTFNE